jgi:hypothetical protein
MERNEKARVLMGQIENLNLKRIFHDEQRDVSLGVDADRRLYLVFEPDIESESTVFEIPVRVEKAKLSWYGRWQRRRAERRKELERALENRRIHPGW